jgi:hypothetical protein
MYVLIDYSKYGNVLILYFKILKMYLTSRQNTTQKTKERTRTQQNTTQKTKERRRTQQNTTQKTKERTRTQQNTTQKV